VNSTPTLTVTSSSITICSGQSATLTAAGAASYTWNNSVTGSTLGISPGVTTVYTVTGADLNNCSSSFSITQTVSDCLGIGSNGLIKNSEVKIFPNPSEGMFIAQFDFTGRKEIRIFDSSGKQIEVRVTNNDTEQFDLHAFEKGIYLIRIDSLNGSANHKLVVQ
jgi:hypothetical protein